MYTHTCVHTSDCLTKWLRSRTLGFRTLWFRTLVLRTLGGVKFHSTSWHIRPEPSTSRILTTVVIIDQRVEPSFLVHKKFTKRKWSLFNLFVTLQSFYFSLLTKCLPTIGIGHLKIRDRNTHSLQPKKREWSSIHYPRSPLGKPPERLLDILNLLLSSTGNWV